jgi:hypothetical protein
MKPAFPRTILLAMMIPLSGCLQQPDNSDRRVKRVPLSPSAAGASRGPQAARTWADRLEPVNADDLVFYLRSLATQITGRILTAEEIGRARSAPNLQTLKQILREWSKEAFFAESARTFINVRLGFGGTRNGVNLDLPGNLAAYIVRTGMPYSKILTADFCIDNAGNRVACDTGAPYAAGVVATRAFLTTYAGRFNLRRANALLGKFACSAYPLNDTLERRLEKSELIPMFAAEQPMSGTGTFGNGTNCYMCHGHFGLHAQFFVKFDQNGSWIANASGLPDPNAESGRSPAGTFSSHHVNPARAGSEASRYLGSEAANLAEAMGALVTKPIFLECAARNVVEHYLGFSFAGTSNSNPVFPSIATVLKARYQDPTFGDLISEALSHPVVFKSLAATRVGAR